MSQQNWSASEYATHASFVPAMASDVMGLLERRNPVKPYWISAVAMAI